MHHSSAAVTILQRIKEFLDRADQNTAQESITAASKEI
jgi:hypothetical protein